jgi:hypothetical protein
MKFNFSTYTRIAVPASFVIERDQQEILSFQLVDDRVAVGIQRHGEILPLW